MLIQHDCDVWTRMLTLPRVCNYNNRTVAMVIALSDADFYGQIAEI